MRDESPKRFKRSATVRSRKKGSDNMRTFFFIFFSLILSLNCSTASNLKVNQGPEPSRELGCSKFKGNNWFRCLENQHKRWEKIESAGATVTVISETREGEYIRTKKRICWTENFCREFEEVVYSPTFFQKLKVTLSTILISVCIGFLIGISF